ncbi:hypothetical protein [Nonomuraea dietziae]
MTDGNYVQRRPGGCTVPVGIESPLSRLPNQWIQATALSASMPPATH